MDDPIVYKAGDVHISRTLAKFGATSYPINSIGSVRVEPPKKRLLTSLGWTLIAMGGVIVAHEVIVAGTEKPPNALMLCLIGLICLRISHRRPHRLMLRVASGDLQALASSKPDELLAIKQAIENAIALRG